jgi:Fe-S-cluster containining protein
MRIRLFSSERERSFDSQLARFTEAEAIPCFRCGVCCRRWQPLVTRLEYERLAAALELDAGTFLVRYARPYPLAEDTYQLNEQDGGCVFLRSDGEGKSLCAVYEARPQACRDWDASLLRRECLEGLDALATRGGLLQPLTLYDDPADAAAFQRHLRDAPTSILAIPGPSPG